MKKQLKVFRIACYVCALPLLATAVAAAHNWMSQLDEPVVENLEMVPSATVDHLRAHVLAADVNGNLHGRIVSLAGESASNLKVYFVNNGQIEQSTVTDADGTFSVEGLVAGPYSLVAAGANGLVAHGVYITTDAAEMTEQSMSIQTAAVGPEFGTVVEFITDHAVPEGEVLDVAPANELELSKIDGSNRILLNQEGHVEGRLVSLNARVNEERDYSSMSARLLRGNETIADVSVDADGSFVVEHVEPGIYDLVAAGDQGFAAISFEVVAADAGEVPATNASYTSTALGFHRHLDCCLAPPVDCGVVYEQIYYAQECCVEEVLIVEEEIVYEEPLPIASDIGYGAAAGCNAGYGGGDFGACCGGGGGGGGFGFGGDFGGLIGAAIGALILSEVIDQLGDDDGVIRQPVVVPPIIIPPVIPPPPISPR